MMTTTCAVLESVGNSHDLHCDFHLVIHVFRKSHCLATDISQIDITDKLKLNYDSIPNLEFLNLCI